MELTILLDEVGLAGELGRPIDASAEPEGFPVEVQLADNAAQATPTAERPGTRVILADGATQDLSTLGVDQLVALQWEQEQAFARRILAAPKGSRQRAETTRRAYDTVTKVLAAKSGTSGGPLAMGLHPRHQRLVVQLLARQRSRGIRPSFFEIGYGCGLLLKRVSEYGFPVAGIEVSAAVREQARRLLGPGHQAQVYLGDFLRDRFVEPGARYSLVYWNDVFEHVPPDEIGDYLKKIYELLVPGGRLVTITPNWHVRPWDVTGAFRPPRTEAAGLHLKEYTLCEVSRQLRDAGFGRVATPLVVTPGRIVLGGGGLAGVKRLLEPLLELVPFALAKLLCRGLALNCTIAAKVDH